MSAETARTKPGATGLDPDGGLLERLAAGDLDALGDLYDRYRGLAYAVALRITNDMSAAEDVVQEGFLAVWRNAAGFDHTRGSVKTWLVAIVHHRAVDHVRRRRPTSTLPEGDALLPAALATEDAWPEVAARLDGAAVRAALADLPRAQRDAIELAYFDGLTQQQIAERTDAPLGTVKGRMRLGLGALRQALSPQMDA